MQKMFQKKNAPSLDGKVVANVKIFITDINVVDVNIATKSRIIEEQVFQDKEPWKKKKFIDWEKEEKLKKTMVETIQQLQKE